MKLVDTTSRVHQIRRRGNPIVRARVEQLLRSGKASWCPAVRLEPWAGVGSDADRNLSSGCLFPGEAQPVHDRRAEEKDGRRVVNPQHGKHDRQQRTVHLPVAGKPQHVPRKKILGQLPEQREQQGACEPPPPAGFLPRKEAIEQRDGSEHHGEGEDAAQDYPFRRRRRKHAEFRVPGGSGRHGVEYAGHQVRSDKHELGQAEQRYRQDRRADRVTLFFRLEHLVDREVQLTENLHRGPGESSDDGPLHAYLIRKPEDFMAEVEPTDIESGKEAADGAPQNLQRSRIVPKNLSETEQEQAHERKEGEQEEESDRSRQRRAALAKEIQEGGVEAPEQSRHVSACRCTAAESTCFQDSGRLSPFSTGVLIYNKGSDLRVPAGPRTTC